MRLLSILLFSLLAAPAMGQMTFFSNLSTEDRDSIIFQADFELNPAAGPLADHLEEYCRGDKDASPCEGQGAGVFNTPGPNGPVNTADHICRNTTAWSTSGDQSAEMSIFGANAVQGQKACRLMTWTNIAWNQGGAEIQTPNATCYAAGKPIAACTGDGTATGAYDEVDVDYYFGAFLMIPSAHKIDPAVTTNAFWQLYQIKGRYPNSDPTFTVPILYDSAEAKNYWHVFSKKNGNTGYNQSGERRFIIPGEAFHFEMRVKLSSTEAAADGEVDIYFNNELKFSQTGWITRGDAQPKIDYSINSYSHGVCKAGQSPPCANHEATVYADAVYVSTRSLRQSAADWLLAEEGMPPRGQFEGVFFEGIIQ